MGTPGRECACHDARRSLLLLCSTTFFLDEATRGRVWRTAAVFISDRVGFDGASHSKIVRRFPSREFEYKYLSVVHEVFRPSVIRAKSGS